METLFSMRILITNDDGFNADGIKSLKKIALEMSTEENIFVVAPSANQSAKSLSINYKTNFEIGCPAKCFFEKEVEKYCYMWREGGQFSINKSEKEIN